MSHLLKERRTKEELKDYLKDKSDDYVLEQYCYTRIALEEDVKKRRYSEHAENVRAMLKYTLMRRLKRLDDSVE